MKLAVISFTERGSRLNRSVSELLRREGIDVESTALAKYAESSGLPPLSCSLHDWTGRMFESRDALLFIGATGIAVRSIAPFVADKRKDPAVVVMDEKGIFAISLLSGHIGGANELAGTLANLTGAIRSLLRPRTSTGVCRGCVCQKAKALDLRHEGSETGFCRYPG